MPINIVPVYVLLNWEGGGLKMFSFTLRRILFFIYTVAYEDLIL